MAVVKKPKTDPQAEKKAEEAKKAAVESKLVSGDPSGMSEEALADALKVAKQKLVDSGYGDQAQAVVDRLKEEIQSRGEAESKEAEAHQMAKAQVADRAVQEGKADTVRRAAQNRAKAEKEKQDSSPEAKRANVAKQGAVPGSAAAEALANLPAAEIAKIKARSKQRELAEKTAAEAQKNAPVGEGKPPVAVDKKQIEDDVKGEGKKPPFGEKKKSIKLSNGVGVVLDFSALAPKGQLAFRYKHGWILINPLIPSRGRHGGALAKKHGVKSGTTTKGHFEKHSNGKGSKFVAESTGHPTVSQQIKDTKNKLAAQISQKKEEESLKAEVKQVKIDVAGQKYAEAREKAKKATVDALVFDGDPGDAAVLHSKAISAHTKAQTAAADLADAGDHNGGALAAQHSDLVLKHQKAYKEAAAEHNAALNAKAINAHAEYHGAATKASQAVTEAQTVFQNIDATWTDKANAFNKAAMAHQHAADKAKVAYGGEAAEVKQHEGAASMYTGKATAHMKVAKSVAAKKKATSLDAAHKAYGEAFNKGDHKNAVRHAKKMAELDPKGNHQAKVDFSENQLKTGWEDTGKVLGSHGAKVMKHEGVDWLVKPQEQWQVDLDLATNGTLKELGLPAPEMITTTVKGKPASAQIMFEGAKPAFPGGFDPSKLSEADHVAIQKQMVADMLYGNHDAHEDNWLRLPDGQLVQVDQGQAFKFGLGKSPTLMPPGNYGTPLYKTYLASDPAMRPEALELAQKASALKTNYAFSDYAKSAEKAGKLPDTADAYDFLDDLHLHASSLADQFQKQFKAPETHEQKTAKAKVAGKKAYANISKPPATVSKPPKFTKAEAGVMVNGKKEIVPGYAAPKGKLFVHKSTSGSGYTVSSVSTGEKMPGDFKTQKEAKAAAHWAEENAPVKAFTKSGFQDAMKKDPEKWGEFKNAWVSEKPWNASESEKPKFEDLDKPKTYTAEDFKLTLPGPGMAADGNAIQALHEQIVKEENDQKAEAMNAAYMQAKEEFKQKHGVVFSSGMVGAEAPASKPFVPQLGGGGFFDAAKEAGYHHPDYSEDVYEGNWKVPASSAAAIRKYTGSAATSSINPQLRKSGPKGGWEGKTIASMDKAFADSPGLPKAMVTVRKMEGNGQFPSYPPPMNPGSEYIDYGYGSTSKSTTAWDGGVVMEVRMPKGTKVVDINHNGVDASNGHEQELLLDRGAKYRVISDSENDTGQRKIVVEVVSTGHSKGEAEAAAEKNKLTTMSGNKTEDAAKIFEAQLHAIGKPDSFKEDVVKAKKAFEAKYGVPWTSSLGSDAYDKMEG